MVSQITCVICARGTSTEKGDSSSRLQVSERLFPTTDEWLPLLKMVISFLSVSRHHFNSYLHKHSNYSH